MSIFATIIYIIQKVVLKKILGKGITITESLRDKLLKEHQLASVYIISKEKFEDCSDFYIKCIYNLIERIEKIR